MGAGFCFPFQLRAAYCHLRHRSGSLLQESDWNEDPKFLARAIAFAWQQATFYPTFTQPPVKLERPPTPAEEKVLRLIPQTSRMSLSARSWTSSFRL